MAATVRSFEELREECLQKGELWEDPDFPATQASVFYHQTPPFTFEWKRPNVSVFRTIQNNNEARRVLILLFFNPQEFNAEPVFISSDCQIVPGKLGKLPPNWISLGVKSGDLEFRKDRTGAELD